MRAYLRVDPELAEKKSSYPDGAFVAFVSTLCAAEQQPHRGRFKTPKILRAYLGKHARWIRFLVAQHDLVELESGVLYVDGWDEWQEGDWKVSERVSRIRNRPKVTVGVTPDVTVGVTVATVNTPGKPPLTLPDSPQEQIANSRRPLATSGKHVGEVGANGLSFEQAAANLVAPVDRDAETVCLWLLDKKGWPAFDTLERAASERRQARLMLELMPLSALVPWLDEQWQSTDPDDRPTTLKYWWRPLQDEQHAALKQQRPHAHVDNGPTKVTPVLPSKKRGST